MAKSGSRQTGGNKSSISTTATESDLATVNRLDSINDMYTSMALDEIVNVGKEGFVARDRNGNVTGALSYDTYDNYIMISILGSTRPGIGSSLMQKVAKIAVARNIAVEVEALSTAVGFYRHIGMTRIGGRSFMWSVSDASEFAKTGKAPSP